MNVLAVEPLCRGGQHAMLNAGLLSTLRISFPDAEITFVAEHSHCSAVEKALGAPAAPPIKFEVLRRQMPGSRLKVPLFSECALMRGILFRVKQTHAEALVLCAVSNRQLLALKLLLWPGRERVSILAIVHSVLQAIIEEPPRALWKRVFSLRNVLQWHSLSCLKIVVPGKTIYDRTLIELPKLKPYLRELELAYLFPDAPELSTIPAAGALRFAFVGVGTRRKGIDAFCRLANEVAKLYRAAPTQQEAAEFVVLGPILERDLLESQEGNGSVKGSDHFLEVGEMESGMRAVHYSVFTHEPRSYELVASGAFLDALAYVKPVIALKNKYFEHHFKQLGDIGYLCESFEEVLATIRGILEDRPSARYDSQCLNILRGRERFSPLHLAPALRQMFL